MKRDRKALLSALKRALKWAGAALGVLVAVPLVLVPLYGVLDPVSVPMLARYATGQNVARHWMPIETVSDRLKASVVMSEDGQFCTHRGIDMGALRDEVEAVLAGRPARGASTITMQVARNLFLWNDRSYLRKALEIPLAVYIDLVLPKRRILEIYLNIAEWGPDGEFGVGAGALRAYGALPEALPWERAALLAVMLPNPHVRDAARPGPGLRRVAGIVANRAMRFGQRAACVHPEGRLEL